MRIQDLARSLEFQIQDLPRGYYVVYKPTTPIFYCSQENFLLFSRPLENNKTIVLKRS